MFKGTIEFGDVIIPIVDIQIREGKFLITGKSKGPIPEYRGPASIYGADSMLLATGGEAECPAADKHQEVTMTLWVRFSTPVAE